MKEEYLIPPQMRFLSGSALKVIAVITMVIDHIGAYFPQKTASIILHLGTKRWMLYTVLRFIGRISFPIFAFLLVEGFLHTHNREHYGIRLFLLALLSELPWNLAHTGTWQCEKQNVMFTLLFGYLALCMIRQIEENGIGRTGSRAFALFALLGITLVFKADYGCRGFGFILMLYLLREKRVSRAIVGCCLMNSTWKEGLAFLPIGFYNGERGFLKGRAASLLFYLIYPLQLLVFYSIRKRTTGF